jgi:hypothetical protein
MLWWTLRQLKSEDANTRQKAAEKLGDSRERRAIEPLLRTLADENHDVRRATVYALGKIGDTRAIEPLSVIAMEENNSLRDDAIVALANIGSVETLLSILPNILQNAWKDGYAALTAQLLIEGLAMSDDPRIADAILDGFGTNVIPRDLIENVGRVLAKFRNPNTLVRLVTTLKENPSTSDMRLIHYMRDWSELNWQARNVLVTILMDKDRASSEFFLREVVDTLRNLGWKPSTDEEERQADRYGYYTMGWAL